MSTIMTMTQQATIKVRPKDRRGNPALVEGQVWSVSDSAILGLEVLPDGFTAKVSPLAIGSAQLQLSNADAVIGEGEDILPPLVEDFVIVAGKATALGFEVVVEEQPE